MTKWYAQSIMYVWFLNSVQEIKASSLYEQITGHEPDNTQRNKMPNPANPFTGTASGVVGNSNFTLQIQPGRMDFIIAPVNSNAEQDPFAFLEIEETVETCTRRIVQQNVAVDNTIRLALVVNAATRVDSVEEGNAVIKALAGYEPGVDDLLDLIIQVNKRSEGVSGIQFNRVLRYGVQTFQDFVLQFGPVGNVIPISRQQNAATITIDINTVPTNVPIAIGDQTAIFSALSAEALRLSGNPSIQGL